MSNLFNECPEFDIPDPAWLAGQLPKEERPSMVVRVPWVYARRADVEPTFHASTERPNAGKWLYRADRAYIDEKWAVLKMLTEDGWLGSSAKSSTCYDNLNAPDRSGSTHVICLFVSDWHNTDDIRKVLHNLRATGFNGGWLNFKRDVETLSRRYVNRGDRRVSIFTAPPDSGDRFYTKWLGGTVWLDGNNDADVIAAIDRRFDDRSQVDWDFEEWR